MPGIAAIRLRPCTQFKCCRHYHRSTDTRYTYRYKVPLPDMCWSQIPGVTQVEKGYAGNTAVATAYSSWVEHGNRSSRTGVPAGYYFQCLFWTFNCSIFICGFRLLRVFLVEKASNWLVSLTNKDCREPASKTDCRGAVHVARVLRGFL